MIKTLLCIFTFLLLNTLTLAAVYQAKITTHIIRTNLQEYYENVLDEVLSSRGKDFLLSMGRMRPDRRGGVFETLQKEAGAFGVRDVHSSCLVKLPDLVQSHINQLHGYLLDAVEPSLQVLYPKVVVNVEEVDRVIAAVKTDGGSFANEELVSIVYSLNQAMGHYLGEQIDQYDIFTRISADMNQCNSHVPEPIQTDTLISKLKSWLFPENIAGSHAFPKRESEQSSVTQRFLTSHLDVVRQDIWAEFDAQINDLIASITQDIWDLE